MGIFDRFKQNKDKKEDGAVKTISIQSSEGIADPVILESMLTQRRLNLSIPGTTNAYTNYGTQVFEIYKKYNGFSDFGTQQTRAIVDLRTGFIAGEGISIGVDNKQTANFIEDFIKFNQLDGIGLINAIKGSEMCGQSLFNLQPVIHEYNNEQVLKVKANRYPYTSKYKYKPLYRDKVLNNTVMDIVLEKDFGEVSAELKNFIYVRTGGDDTNSRGPVTKVAIVLTDIENYDRALKDIRRLNHILARITPTFKTNSDNETKSLIKLLSDMRWKIGQAFIGSADFEYKTPNSGAHDNLVKEMVATIKTITAVTGVPVHWLGYVDLMSNRSTADSLYESIKNATSAERIIWEKGLYNLILKAQEVYIDSGGMLKFNKDFQVRLPLIRFEEFLSMVKGLNIAYNDGAISMEDYRNSLQGIDPMQTKKAVKKEEKEEQKSLLTVEHNPLNKGDKDGEEKE